jgi:hypothetical protein
MTLLPDGRLLVLDRGVLTLHASHTGKVLLRFTCEDSNITSFAVSRDGTRLITACEDTTALVWDLVALVGGIVPSCGNLGGKEMAVAWADLGSRDAPRAARAVELLAGSPAQAVVLLKQRLPAPVTQRVEELLKQLASPSFAKRQRAEQELTELGDLAEPGLRYLLTGKSSVEERRRAERLLAKLEAKPLSSDALRWLRCVELLERLRTADARDLLRALAGHSPLAWGTLDARQALERLSGK